MLSYSSPLIPICSPLLQGCSDIRYVKAETCGASVAAIVPDGNLVRQRRKAGYSSARR